MVGVETIARIRYEFFSRDKKIKQIARELGAEFPRCGSPHLFRSNPVGRRLPHLGFNRRQYRSGQQKITLEIDGKQIAAELFRRTPKALTITGNLLDSIRKLTNLDRVFDWAVVWGERRKAAAAAAAATQPIDGHGFNGGGPGHGVDHIERIVREGGHPTPTPRRACLRCVSSMTIHL